MEQGHHSSIQIEEEQRSNCEEIGERSDIIQKATFSIIKNESLISLLSTRPPFNRTERQCRAIADYLKLEPYFEAIAKNFKALLQISSWIEYRQAQMGEYIYRVHDMADCFYVLIQGEVHLTFPEKEVLEQEADSLEDNDANSARNLKDSTFYPTAVPALTKNYSTNPLQQTATITPKRLTRHQSLYSEELVQVQPPPPKKLVFEQRIVQIVSHGESFGDLGESSRRGTNAIAKELCHLLLIKKQFAGTLSSAHTKSDSKMKYQLLSSLPLFKLLYRYSVESIIYLMEEVKVGYNSMVYSQEEPIKYVYIIFKGEFKLYKKVKCSKGSNTVAVDNQQERRTLTKNTSFKIIQLGEILAYTEVYRKIGLHQETCVCKSQEGVVLRIDKNKFMKKILSTENNLEEIIPFIEAKAAQRLQEAVDFLKRYENNNLFVRYLHTPSAKSRRVNTESAVYKQRSERKEELRRLSTAGNNFFNEFNKTVKQEVRSTRISVKKSMYLGEQRATVVPSRIKDIIGIVQQESNYYKIRKPKQNITLFDFNISKVPIHVKKKYEILFKKQNK